MCEIVILSSIVDIIRILLVKLVKYFFMFPHIIYYQMDFWWIKVFNSKYVSKFGYIIVCPEQWRIWDFGKGQELSAGVP